MKEKEFLMLNRILLGLLVLVPGIMKLFVMGPGAVAGMLSTLSLFAWAPAFWAWILILSEILFGIAVLANYKLKWTTIPPAIIMTVAGFSFYINNMSMLLLHLVAASNYLIWMKMGKK